MKRRDFLQNILLSSAALGYWTSGAPFSFAPKRAMAAEGKTLVKVFQRGGCDGVNVVVPYGEDNYYTIRPTIAISAPGTAGGALDLNGFFGLHPAMAEIHGMFNQGQVAILPATHYPEGSRSHFDSQHYVESAVRMDSETGWMNRHMNTLNQPAELRGVSIGNNLDQSLRGNFPVTTLSNFNNVGLRVEEEEESQMLARLQLAYDHPVEDLKNHRLVQSFGQQLLGNINLLTRLRDEEYVPENGALYPNSGLARQLQMVAKLIKAGIGLEMASVNIGGWDTHSDQGGVQGRQASRLTEMSQAIAAFYQDLGPVRQNDVATMIGTEFGRTARENGSFGTDHGTGAAWFVLGGGVNGGIYGDWPGFSDEAIERNALQWTVNHRDIYADTLRDFLLNPNIGTVLPGHAATPLGLFG